MTILWTTAATPMMHPPALHVLALSHCRIGMLEHISGHPSREALVIEETRHQFARGVRDHIIGQPQRLTNTLPLIHIHGSRSVH